ncbi:hypothetical protein ABEB36_006578 [Hypothenemus hampei]|uniref:Uncharacterized protein n=1 Tax=Hypothenemus hampei TaxID=57062 RepID=A0ABD1ERS0_HYPHA
MLHVKEKHANIRTRGKSRRTTHDILKFILKENDEDCKKLPYLLQKYCDDRLCPFYPKIQNFLIAEDGQVVHMVHPLEEINANVNNRNLTVVTYSDHNSHLKIVICKTTTEIDDRVFFALSQTYRHFPTITILRLDYCNLSATHVEILKNNLPKTITELSLAGNPNRSQNFYHLIRCDIKILSLKFCNIDEKGLEKIALEFLNNYSDPPKLLHLDLSHNQIFDNGCIWISTILHCDRSLQSLNLTDCKIGDEGFKCLLACFNRFALDNQEIVIRRKIRLNYFKSVYLPKSYFPEAVFLNSSLAEIIKTHPFTSEQVRKENNQILCPANSTLKYMNLAYNRLRRPSFDGLLKALMEQNMEKTLQNVIFQLDGNSSDADDLKVTIEELLLNRKFLNKNSSKSINNGGGIKSLVKRKKSSGSIRSANSKGRNSISLNAN